MLRPGKFGCIFSMDEFKQAVSDVQLKKNTLTKIIRILSIVFLTIRFMNISFTG